MFVESHRYKASSRNNLMDLHMLRPLFLLTYSKKELKLIFRTGWTSLPGRVRWNNKSINSTILQSGDGGQLKVSTDNIFEQKFHLHINLINSRLLAFSLFFFKLFLCRISHVAGDGEAAAAAAAVNEANKFLIMKIHICSIN